VTGERVTIREWVEERDKAMAAEFKAHRAETKLDIANLAAAFGKQLQAARDADRAEARTSRDTDRAEARSASRWTWGITVGVGLALAGLILS